MAVGNTEVIVDLVIMVTGLADLAQDSIEMLLDVVELVHSNAGLWMWTSLGGLVARLHHDQSK